MPYQKTRSLFTLKFYVKVLRSHGQKEDVKHNIFIYMHMRQWFAYKKVRKD